MKQIKFSLPVTGNDRLISTPVSFSQDNGLDFPAIISGPAENDLDFERSSMRKFYRIAVVAQSLLLCVMVVLIMLMFVMGSRMSSNFNYYYSLAEPVIHEMTNHSLSVMQHADSSAAAMERMVQHSEVVSDVSLESLAESVNRTVAAVRAMTEIARHPVMKIGLEAM